MNKKDFHQSMNRIFICPIRRLMKILPEMDEVSLDDGANGGWLDEYVFVQFED